MNAIHFGTNVRREFDHRSINLAGHARDITRSEIASYNLISKLIEWFSGRITVGLGLGWAGPGQILISSVVHKEQANSGLFISLNSLGWIDRIRCHYFRNAVVDNAAFNRCQSERCYDHTPSRSRILSLISSHSSN